MGSKKERKKDTSMGYQGVDIPANLPGEAGPDKMVKPGDVLKPVLDQWAREALDNQLDKVLMNLGEIRAQIRSGEKSDAVFELIRSVKQSTDEYLDNK